jgi:hypothetical protein
MTDSKSAYRFPRLAMIIDVVAFVTFFAVVVILAAHVS